MQIALGDLERACGLAPRLEAGLGDSPGPQELVPALIFRAQLAFFLGAYREALTSAARAVAIADGSGRAPLRTAARRGSCLVFGNLGTPNLRDLLLERERLCDPGDLWDRAIIQNDLATLAIESGDLVQAAERLGVASALAELVEGPDDALRATLDATRAQLLVARGRPVEALHALASAEVRLAAGASNHLYLIGCVTLLTIQAKRSLGDLAGAEGAGRAGLARLHTYLPVVRRDILLATAEVQRELGDVAAAYEGLRTGMELERAMARQFMELQDDLNRVVGDHERARTEAERLRDIADHDCLTGVFNRRHLQSLAFEATEPAAVAVFDLDTFKAVNDTFGHAVGDRVLVRVAGILAANARADDHVVRLGGDEFVVVMPGVDDDGARHCVDRLQRALGGENWQLMIPGVAFGASAGYATGGGGDIASMLEAADRRLLAAKRAGRGRAVGPGGDVRPQRSDRGWRTGARA